MTDPGTADATVRTCERYWQRTGVPPDAVEDMRGELEAHLLEAVAAGRSVESVVGPDIEAFAEEWAREFRPPIGGSREGGAGTIVLAVIAGILCLLASLMVPTSTTTTVTECCPERVVEVSSSTSSAALAISLLLVGAGILALAGAWMLRRERLRAGAVLMGLAAAVAVVTPLGLVAGVLLVIATIWTLWRRSGVPGARGWAVASLILAGFGSLVVLIGPIASSSSTSIEADGASITHTSTTLAAQEGWYVVALATVPVAIALVPVLAQRTSWARGARWAAAALLTAGILIAVASIGLLYLPSAVTMVIAATSKRGSGASTSPAPSVLPP